MEQKDKVRQKKIACKKYEEVRVHKPFIINALKKNISPLTS